MDIGYSDPLRFRLLNRSDLREITAKKWGMSWQRKRASSAATDWEALNRQSRGAGALGTGGAGYDASSDQVTRAATLAGAFDLAVGEQRGEGWADLGRVDTQRRGHFGAQERLALVLAQHSEHGARLDH